MTSFNNLTDIYEALIDWPKRLGHEAGFYRHLFAETNARSILDAACGIGHHAAMFHDWGLKVEAADISTGMIERGRTQFGEKARLRWVVRGFTEPIRPQRLFDVAICVGNSLALAADLETVGSALATMLAAVRDGGAVVVHVLNLWRLADGPCLWQKCLRTTLRGEPVLIHKGVHRHGSQGYVDLVVTQLREPPEYHSESVRFSGLTAELLEPLARNAGARALEFYGGYQQEPYDPRTSQDLILVAGK